jgi:hypothetical protein
MVSMVGQIVSTTITQAIYWPHVRARACMRFIYLYSIKLENDIFTLPTLLMAGGKGISCDLSPRISKESR